MLLIGVREYKVRAGVKSRIYLSTGEYIDTVESYKDIIKWIDDCGIKIKHEL